MNNKYSLEALFADNYKLLFRIIYYITHDVDDTYEILHDTYIKAVNKVDIKRSKNEVMRWLMTIAHNTAISYVTRRKKHEILENHENVLGVSDISLSVFILYNLALPHRTVRIESEDLQLV